LAGAGFKDFTAGEVLTATDVDTYLMQQTVMVFGGTAARASALGTVVAEGMLSYLSDSNSVEYYNGAEWEPLGGGGAAVHNLLDNGAMQVHQRGTADTGITGSSGVIRTADRWEFQINHSGSWTQDIRADGPTGFSESFRALIYAGSGAPGAAEYCFVRQKIEGQNLQLLSKGTAGAREMTLSFWVKSNATGTYVCEIQDDDNNRHISKAYTIDSIDTWEKKEILIDADTTGALDNDNEASLDVSFWLVAGSDTSSGTLATSWASYVAANRAVGQRNLAENTNYYWQVTGVQLEAATEASEFQHKAYSDELLECQRYYFKFRSGGSNYTPYGPAFGRQSSNVQGMVSFPVEMRVPPTALETTGTASDYRVLYQNANEVCTSVPTFTSAGTLSSRLIFSGGSVFTVGEGAMLTTNFSSSTSFLAWSADL
jgi:hypothetical protein